MQFAAFRSRAAALVLVTLLTGGGCCCHQRDWLLHSDCTLSFTPHCRCRCRACGAGPGGYADTTEQGEAYSHSRFHPVPTRNAFAPRGFDGLPQDNVFYGGPASPYPVYDSPYLEPAAPLPERNHPQHLRHQPPSSQQTVQAAPDRSPRQPEWIYQSRSEPAASPRQVTRRQAINSQTWNKR